MKIAAYEDDSGRAAIGIKLDDGVLPSGHPDLKALIKAGPRELDRLRQAARTRANWCIRRSFAHR